MMTNDLSVSTTDDEGSMEVTLPSEEIAKEIWDFFGRFRPDPYVDRWYTELDQGDEATARPEDWAGRYLSFHGPADGWITILGIRGRYFTVAILRSEEEPNAEQGSCAA